MFDCSMKPFNSSDIKTFTIHPCDFTRGLDEKLVYIDSVSKKDNCVIVKPINAGNFEAINKVRDIMFSYKLGAIVQTSKGSSLGVHQSQVESLPKPSKRKIVVKFKDKTLSLGRDKAPFKFDDNAYLLYLRVYKEFVEEVGAVIDAQRAKKSQKEEATV